MNQQKERIKDKSREEILLLFYNAFIIPLFNRAGYTLPVNIRVSIGLMPRKKVVGITFHKAIGKDYWHIFISTELCKNVYEVFETLIHEAIHTMVFNHLKEFSTCAAKVGLKKPWHATTATDNLVLAITQWIDDNNVEWYEPELKLPDIKKQLRHQRTRMIKLYCPDCNYIIRTSRLNITTKGYPICSCGTEFIE